MKKIALIYGTITGAICITNGIIMVNLMTNNPTLETNDFLGYVFMLVVLSLVFFGIRNYRNKHLDGFISFGKAFKTGALIALVAATVYVLVWLFYFYNFAPDFMEVYTQYVLSKTPETELAAKTEEMAVFSKMYENPLLVILITYSEILPLALVVVLVSALILKKKPIPAA